MKKVLALVAVAGIAGVASAQTATMTVTADGTNAVTVNPGESVNINAELSWTGAVQFAGVKGAIRVEGNGGAGSNFTSDFPAGLQVLYGAFNGGSREGMDFAITPALFTGGTIIPPSGNSSGVTIGNYTLDTTGMAAGTYNVGWEAEPTAPSVRLYLTTTSPGFVEAQSTYIGATITIVPAPASLALVGLGGLVAGRRRR
jgi:hypothetical protein